MKQLTARGIKFDRTVRRTFPNQVGSISPSKPSLSSPPTGACNSQVETIPETPAITATVTLTDLPDNQADSTMNFDQVLASLKASQALEAAKASNDKSHSPVHQVASDGQASSPITGNDSNLNSTAAFVVQDLSSNLTPEYRTSTPCKSTFAFILVVVASDDHADDFLFFSLPHQLGAFP